MSHIKSILDKKQQYKYKDRYLAVNLGIAMRLDKEGLVEAFIGRGWGGTFPNQDEKRARESGHNKLISANPNPNTFPKNATN